MAKSSFVGSSLLRAALVGAAILVSHAPQAFARIGVTSATDGDPLGKPPAENERVLRIGIDVQANELITTKANDRAHLMFLDGTSITIGPNAQMTLDKFVYDPDTKKGELAMTASKGVFRVVGGKISKTNAITVKTPSSTIGIRGGISIFTVTSTQTVAAFAFGHSVTMSTGTETKTLVRAGTQLVANLNGTMGNPTAANVGGAMGALEGKGGGNQGGNADQQSQSSGFSGQNSGQGPTTTLPPTITTLTTNSSQTVTNAVSNANTTQQNDQALQNNQPPARVPVTVKTTTTDTQVDATTTTTVVVTRGRFLQDKPYKPRTFDPDTLHARRNPDNNQTLSPTGTTSGTTTTTTTTVTNTTTTDGVVTDRAQTVTTDVVTGPTLATISAPAGGSDALAVRGRASGGSLTVPWMPGQIVQFTGDTPFGPAHAVGAVSPNQDFFAYSFVVDSSGQKFVLFGGTPTTKAQFPKIGIGAQSLINLFNPGTLDSPNLPLAPDRVAGNADIKAAANASPLYSVYTPNLNGTSESRPSVPDALQVTVSIAGTGTMQKSYMGVFIVNYGTDRATHTVYGAGTLMDSYRLGSHQHIGRGISHQATADTGAGTAIYGDTGQYQVYIPDQITTTRRRGRGESLDDASFSSSEGYHHHVGTRRVDGAALDQAAANRRPTSYYPVTVATPVPDPSTLPADLGQNRTTQTMKGFVGGLIEERQGNHFRTRVPNITFSRPSDVRISTDAATNQAMGTIVMRGLDGTLYSPKLTLELGGTSGGNGPTSAFIDDSRYAMITQTNERGRHSTVRFGESTRSVNDNTMLASYKTAPVALPGGVQPCVCAYLSWGFWSSNINYSSRHTDNINLGTYVVGDVTKSLQMPITGNASFSGFMIGDVSRRGASYVGTGTYTSAADFANRTASFNATFDGRNYSAPSSLGISGSSFGGSIVSSSGRQHGQINGAFFNAPGQPAAYQGGAFTIGNNQSRYQASGIFAGQRTGP